VRVQVRRRSSRALLAVLALAAVIVVARWPVTTSEGVNFHVSLKKLTLFEKAVAFVDRDLEMYRMTREIAGEDGAPEQRLLRMYRWVTENIQSVPPGIPVVDNHVLYIFVRRYGTIDQRAEALAALASYDGMPASTIGLGKDPNRRPVQLTAVQLDNRIVVFDVNNRLVFRAASGELASLADLQADPSIVEKAAGGLLVDGTPYHQHFRSLRNVTPSFVRMEEQRFWPRMKHEIVKRFIGT
jgi:hypothetical protein